MSMTPDLSPTFVPSVLAEHLMEFAGLWQRRESLPGEEDKFLDDLRRIDERLLAHWEGLLLAGAAALPHLVSHLESDDLWIVSTAALGLLGLAGDESDQVVREQFLSSDGDRRQALGRALCVAPIDRLVGWLIEVVLDADLPVAVAAAEILARHRRLERRHARWRGGIAHADPAVRQAAWRVVALVDRGAGG